MESESVRIVYMGTPGFAVAPLEKLLDAGCNVVAVITAPDRPAGRGKKIRYPAVKEYVENLKQEIPVLQPENLKHPGFIRELMELQPDLQVVVAFRMLPEVVWRIPRLGTFNLHASLLPQYRGAAPINHAIINGETETGVTTFMIDEQIDTGNILLQEKTEIGTEESAGELHDRLMVMGAELVLETVNRLAEGTLQARSQDHFIEPGVILKKAPKIQKDFCRIDWTGTGRDIYNLIRGLSPVPAAFTHLEKSDGSRILCKIYATSFEDTTPTVAPGTILTDGKKYLKAAVADGYVQIHSLQQEGKQRMDVNDFLAGMNLSSGHFRFS